MGTISKPNTFSANTTISSSEVNDNFDTIYNEFNGSIAAANLATGAVTTAKIADSNVTTAKIADDNVTAAKLADASVFPANLTAGLSGSSWAWQTWAPTFTNLSGGTLNFARYSQVGKTVRGRLFYTLAGAGVAGTVSFTLPVTPHADYTGTAALKNLVGTGVLMDATATAGQAHLRIKSDGTCEVLVRTAGGTYLDVALLSSTVPFTWASGDAISLTFEYEAA